MPDGVMPFWSTRPDANWRTSRWQRDPVSTGHRYTGRTSRRPVPVEKTKHQQGLRTDSLPVPVRAGAASTCSPTPCNHWGICTGSPVPLQGATGVQVDPVTLPPSAAAGGREPARPAPGPIPVPVSAQRQVLAAATRRSPVAGRRMRCTIPLRQPRQHHRKPASPNGSKGPLTCCRI